MVDQKELRDRAGLVLASEGIDDPQTVRAVYIVIAEAYLEGHLDGMEMMRLAIVGEDKA